jgi:hypothetical protein
MMELVLVFCLIDSPDRCIERNEPIPDTTNSLACASLGQQVGQNYLHTHPNWRLVTWRCQDATRHQDPA